MNNTITQTGQKPCGPEEAPRPHNPSCQAIVALLLSLALPATAQKWELSPGATCCASVHVSEPAEAPELGILVSIPAGGLLPGKYPVPDVRDAATGKMLESMVVGYDPGDAMLLIFAAQPQGTAVDIYFRPSDRPVPNPKGCRLIPSVILMTKVGNANLATARKLATWPQPADIRMGRFAAIGSCVNPYGADSDYSAWFCGAFNFPKKRHLYLATLSSDGSEFSVDGKVIVTWDGNHGRHGGSKGEHGKWLDLQAGVHRVDYFQYASRDCKRPEAQLAWKGDGVILQNTNNLPEFVNNGWAKSGEATIDSIRYKDGKTGAAIAGNDAPVGYVWSAKAPLFLFKFVYSGADPKATYSWLLGKNSLITNQREVEWLVPGDPQNRFSSEVSLISMNAAGTVKATKRVWAPWTPPEPFSLNDPAQNLSLRRALLNMLKGVSKGDPCVDWTPDHWELITELLEPYRCGPILHEIFNRSFAGSYRKVPTADERAALEDRFIETLRLSRDDNLLRDWIDKFEKSGLSGGKRTFRWKDERFCAELFDIGDTNAARKALVFLKEIAGTPDQKQVAALREGDLARATGDLAGAAKAYRTAQEIFRSRNSMGMAGGRTRFVDPSKRATPTNTTDTVKGDKAKPRTHSLKSLTTAATSKVEDWKVYTLNSASMYTTILSFIGQGAIADAFQKLAEWENRSPLAKLEGEYQMAAAKLYIAVEDYRRAINILATYRRNAAMDALLADAYQTEIECWDKLKKPAKIKELANEFLKHFPGHPYEKEMKQWLE